MQFADILCFISLGNTSNVAKSNEEEVVEVVRIHLGARETDVLLAHKLLGPDDSTTAEADGVVVLPDFTALVEVKSLVRASSVDQLDRLCRIWRERSGRNVKGFVGGPFFDKGVKNLAFSRGFSVIEVSGTRYRVMEKDVKENVESEETMEGLHR
jgi:hypothetical protein